MGWGKWGGTLAHSPWVLVPSSVKRGLDSWVLSGPERVCTLERSMGHENSGRFGPDLLGGHSLGDAVHPPLSKISHLFREGRGRRLCTESECQEVGVGGAKVEVRTVSYTHLTLPTIVEWCRSRWSPYH